MGIRNLAEGHGFINRHTRQLGDLKWTPFLFKSLTSQHQLALRLALKTLISRHLCSRGERYEAHEELNGLLPLRQACKFFSPCLCVSHSTCNTHPFLNFQWRPWKMVALPRPTSGWLHKYQFTTLSRPWNLDVEGSPCSYTISDGPLEPSLRGVSK